MAPALSSSNSFLLQTTPYHSRRQQLSSRTPRLSRVFARKNTEETPSSGDGPNFNELFSSFNFGKVPDVKALIPVVANRSSSGLSFGNPRSKDGGTVFVSGATGQAGIRIAQTLLRQGFTVRAGVPDLGAAQELALLAATYKILSKEETKRLNAVESTYNDAKTIAKAIGNASKVVVTIGTAENGPTGEVTISDALQVIEAAQLAGVGHVAIVYDSTTALSTGNVLDGISSFFGNLFSQKQQLTIQDLLQAIVETNVKYTLIKTRLTDDFSPEGSYNVVVAAEGSSSAGASDYKVAKSQIATLVASVFSNTAVAENKVVEVSTDPEVSSKPFNELFSAIPEDGRRKAYAEAIAKEKAAEEAKIANERALAAAKATQQLEEEVKKLEEQKARASTLAEDALAKAEAAGAPSIESLLDKAKGVTSGFSWDNLSSQLATAVQNSAAAAKPKVQMATVRGQAKARSLSGTKAVIKEPTKKPRPAAPKAKEAPKQVDKANVEVKKLFGGLFQQETIYVDE